MIQEFAVNRKATYHAEVKSEHFGKAQVSLHPTMAFYKNETGQLVRHVAMFFSDDIGHDYHAVHTYTEKMLQMLKGETKVEDVIIWSDGTVSLYKVCFYLQLKIFFSSLPSCAGKAPVHVPYEDNG